ncbi:MAG: glutamate--tRNA ligase, partial [Candidatus Sericytochromatia bacterium]
HHGGTFILRVEDTDVARSTEASVQAILDGMSWLGLDWDEGPGKEGPHAPYFQTQRLDTYREAANKLIASGRAYKCFLTAEELEQKRKEAAEKGEAPRYNRAWQPEPLRAEREAAGAPHVLRFKAPEHGTIVVEDLVRGTVTFEAAEMVDDFVLVKADGIPTYNFAVVIDDATMEVTHVLRGDDHLSNTPKQIAVYEALGLPLPKFGHIPMILGPDKTRLSKRHGATSVMQYEADGFLPSAMINYLVRLGWSHGDQEIFTIEEMTSLFDADGINKTAAVFDHAKLEWLNAHYIKEAAPGDLVGLLKPRWAAQGLPVGQVGEDWLEGVVKSLQVRARTLNELAEQSAFYFHVPVSYDPEAASKFLKPENVPLLTAMRDRLGALGTWDEASLEALFKQFVEERGIKLGAAIQPCRVAVSGRTATPGMYEVLALMGKGLVLERFDEALKVAGQAA